MTITLSTASVSTVFSYQSKSSHSTIIIPYIIHPDSLSFSIPSTLPDFDISRHSLCYKNDELHFVYLPLCLAFDFNT